MLLLPLSLLLVVTFLDPAAAVDRSKFKTCEQSGFCRRNRRLSNPELGLQGMDFRLVPESIRIASDSFSAELSAGEPDRSLVLDVTGLESGVVRARFREKNALHSRYEVTDSLIPMQQSKIVYRPKPQTISVGQNSKLVLQFHPFQLDFYNGNGDHVLMLNGRRFFNWEFYRARPSEIVDDIDSEWNEKFGSHDDEKPHGPSSVGMDATFVGAEHVFGIPSHATNMSLPSTRGSEKRYSEPFRMYNLDVFEYELDNPMALYGHVPFMMSHSAAHSAGLLWLNAAETWIDVDASTAPGSVQTHWISESGIVDLFLLPGPSPRDVLAQYAQITGTGALPPRFAIGYHQCKWNYKNELEISELDANFDQHEIAYDVSWLDIEHTNGKRYMTWDATHFPTPKRMIDEVAAKGRRMVTIVDPHLKRDAGYSVHTSAQSGGHYIKDRKGAEYDGWCWPGSSSWPDFLSPAVRAWWAGLFAYDTYHGSTPALFTWNDMNEPSVFNGPEVTMHKDAQHLDGAEHRDVHNLYGMMFHAATVQGQVERNVAHDQRPFVLSRALFAGTQRHGAIWTGDNLADWGHLRASTPMLLSLGVAGISFAGADVGGFFGNPDGELLARWYQLGALQPFFRAHAHLDSKRREPWVFGEPYLSAMRAAVRTRYALMPYLYTLFHEASVNGAPVVRPLWFEFPTEKEFFAEETSFMLGPALLVRPVTESGQVDIEVRLPAGGAPWYRYDTLAPVDSESSDGLIRESAPMERGAPSWLRGGSIVVRQQRVRRASSQMIRDPVTLVVALDASRKAKGSFYWDDGATYAHQSANQHLFRHFHFADNALVCSGLNSGGYQSHVRVERILIVGLSASLSSVSTGDLEWDAASSMLTVRRPDVSLDQDWTIKFE